MLFVVVTSQSYARGDRLPAIIGRRGAVFGDPASAWTAVVRAGGRPVAAGPFAVTAISPDQVGCIGIGRRG